ncbi:DUF4920 domain-containing protein [Maribacter sp. 2210JD10-5]|uniref:DUF4920 domain-containing protein n=1 Tax=Maribacter sp. 2210JD10-5 TaxID=3386272 RepID=UPI0039BC989C
MKRFNILLVFIAFGFSVYAQEKNNNTDLDYSSFGEKITAENVQNEIGKTYQTIAVTDTVVTKFRAIVKEVCKAKGCWMKLELAGGEEAMVKFKDYGFFVPTDINGKEVVVNGLAFVNEMSVEEQRHYAKDGGKSDTEIAKITEPKRTYSFEADGVLVKD